VAEIGHVQVADDPGRGAPGTGRAPVSEWLAALADSGYEGVVGLEYLEVPGVPSFDWIARWRNG
jgi:hydroxypyruvate isomerase